MRPDIANADGIDIEILPGTGWAKVAHIHPLVYPPENSITAVWASIQWANAERRFVASRNGEAFAHVGLYFRDGLRDSEPVQIVGIGSVMTHPAYQKRGYAKRLLYLAHEAARAKRMDFALLVCETNKIPFYQRQGWQLFRGRTVCRQRGTDVDWTLSPVMVRDVCRSAPDGGTGDLRGLPW